MCRLALQAQEENGSSAAAEATRDDVAIHPVDTRTSADDAGEALALVRSYSKINNVSLGPSSQPAAAILGSKVMAPTVVSHVCETPGSKRLRRMQTDPGTLHSSMSYKQEDAVETRPVSLSQPDLSTPNNPKCGGLLTTRSPLSELMCYCKDMYNKARAEKERAHREDGILEGARVLQAVTGSTAVSISTMADASASPAMQRRLDRSNSTSALLCPGGAVPKRRSGNALQRGYSTSNTNDKMNSIGVGEDETRSRFSSWGIDSGLNRSGGRTPRALSNSFGHLFDQPVNIGRHDPEVSGHSLKRELSIHFVQESHVNRNVVAKVASLRRISMHLKAKDRVHALVSPASDGPSVGEPSGAGRSWINDILSPEWNANRRENKMKNKSEPSFSELTAFEIQSDDSVDSALGAVAGVTSEKDSPCPPLLLQNSSRRRSSSRHSALAQVLDVNSFNGVVVGGEYQHCWIEGSPVITPLKGRSQDHVVGVTMQALGSLSVYVFRSAEKRVFPVDLGEDWTLMTAMPVGYLVTGAKADVRGGVYYYLPHHPLKWSSEDCDTSLSWSKRGSPAASAGHSATALSFSLCSSSEASNSFLLNRNKMEVDAEGMETSHGENHSFSGNFSSPSHTKAFKLNCLLPNTSSDNIENWRVSPVTNAFIKNQDSSDDGDTSPLAGDIRGARAAIGVLPMEFQEDDSSVDPLTIDPQLSLIDEDFRHGSGLDEMKSPGLSISIENLKLDSPRPSRSSRSPVSRSDWCHPVVVAALFGFQYDAIIGDCDKFSNVKNASIPRLNVTALATANLGDMRAVCKTWAVAGSKVLARLGSEEKHLLSYNYHELLCLLNISKSEFVSEGSCKRVHKITRLGTGNKQVVMAVSVMDVEDLKDREMDTAVRREMEISLFFSTLVTLNICPHFVEIESVFKSPFSVLDNWESHRPGRGRGDIGSKRLKRGGENRYQYIVMEYCEGKDVEDYVRKVHLPEVDDVRSMLFQMMYAVYASREVAQLRHYDIKLLNFMVTYGGAMRSMLKESLGERDSPSTFSTVYSIGEHDFILAYKWNGLGLVKMADFGTSETGFAELGLPVSSRQVTIQYTFVFCTYYKWYSLIVEKPVRNCCLIQALPMCHTVVYHVGKHSARVLDSRL